MIQMESQLSSLQLHKKNEDLGFEQMDPHFFDGIDENLGMPPSEDNNAEREIPESTPAGPRYPQRIRQPAAVLLSPNTTIASTPPVKKNRKKDKIVVSTIGENLGRPLLETYIEQDVTALNLLVTLDPAIYTTHRLYNLKFTWEFWASLLGYAKSGWLESWHVDLWSLLLMEARPKDARWRVVPTTLMRVDQDDDWSAICEGIDNARNGGVSGPPWWTVDRLFVPINIPDLHWFMAEVNLKMWKVTIYDSMKGAFRRFGEGGENVPQQTGPLGDCGIFLCMFMEKLASGLPLTLDRDAQQAAVAFSTFLSTPQYFFIYPAVPFHQLCSTILPPHL
ncbi:hypothetical protein LXL04_014859 [Taraxacum kok-saghyz]